MWFVSDVGFCKLTIGVKTEKFVTLRGSGFDEDELIG